MGQCQSVMDSMSQADSNVDCIVSCDATFDGICRAELKCCGALKGCCAVRDAQTSAAQPIKIRPVCNTSLDHVTIRPLDFETLLPRTSP